MRSKKIWLPDGQSCRVEWYLSENKAVGIESISDDWLPENISHKRQAGFKNNCDPELDLPDYRRFGSAYDDDE